ncbi:MAG: CBS domain-containing protein [Candidatus Woesearchaeota archaeon]
MLYFSTILGRKIIDSAEEEIGTLEDLIIIDGEDEAEVVALVCKRKTSPLRIPIKFVDVIERVIKLSIRKEKALLFGEPNPDEILLKSSILDKQLIDTNGAKIVRVNDIALLHKNNGLFVIGVDASFKGLLRRLGVGSTIPAIPKFLKKGGEVEVPNMIPWKFVAPLEPDPRHLKLKIERENLNKIHPADLANIIGQLSREERILVMRSLDENVAAEALAEADPGIQKSLLEEMKLKRIKDILDKMSADEIADLLSISNREKAEEILSLLKPEISAQVKQIMQYPENTAGAMMSTDFISVQMNMTAQEVIEKMRKRAPNSSQIYYIYVVDSKGKLVGVLSIRSLLIANPKKKVADFMNTEIAKVEVTSPKQHIAKLLSKYNLLALPVVDSEGVLKGIVTAHDVVDELMPDSWDKKDLKRQRVISNGTKDKSSKKKGRGEKAKK